MTPLRRLGQGFVAHDGLDKLLVWMPLDGGFVQNSELVPTVAWDLQVVNLGPDALMVAASHDPQGLLLIDDALAPGELLAVEAVPYRAIDADFDGDQQRDLIATLDRGFLGVWLSTDAGWADPIFFDVGPIPREIGYGTIVSETGPEWIERPVVAVTSFNTITVLFPNP